MEPDKTVLHDKEYKKRKRGEKYYYTEVKSDPQELLKKVKPQTPPYTFYIHPENRVKKND